MRLVDDIGVADPPCGGWLARTVSADPREALRVRRAPTVPDAGPVMLDAVEERSRGSCPMLVGGWSAVGGKRAMQAPGPQSRSSSCRCIRHAPPRRRVRPEGPPRDLPAEALDACWAEFSAFLAGLEAHGAPGRKHAYVDLMRATIERRR